MKYKLFVVIGGIVVVSAALMGVNHVAAQTPTPASYPSIIQLLAQKLGIDQTRVQQAFDEIHQEKKVQMEARMEQVLEDAVRAGKLTGAQKNALLEKLQSLKSQNQTSREHMMNQKQELQDWAKQQGIDIRSIFGGLKPHFGIMRPMGRHGWNK